MSIESQLTIRQLRAFVAVYRQGKLSAAAEELNITQSAVSVLIRQLEATLNTQLFDRTTRSLEPTLAADEAIGVSERILQDVGALGSSFRDLVAGRRGRVHLVATPATAMAYLPDTVRRFARTHPGINVLLDDCAPDQFLPSILSERVEFGIGAAAPSGAGFESRPLHDDALRLVCAADHSLACKARVYWSDLDEVDMIAFKTGYGVRRLIDTTLANAGASPRIVGEVGFLNSAIWMVACGLGIGILPARLVTRYRPYDVVVRDIEKPTLTRTISLVTRKGRSLSPSCRRFVEMLEQDIAAETA